LVDASGNLAKFILLPGQRHDSIGVDALLDGITIDALIPDKAFDTNAIRTRICKINYWLLFILYYSIVIFKP
jgi:hypothetical protein